MIFSNESSLSPDEKIIQTTLQLNATLGQQQDLSECMDRCISLFEKCFQNEELDLFKRYLIAQ